MRLLIVVFLFAAPALAQDGSPASANPLAELKVQVDRVLADANLPFTSEQDSAVALMMDERLRSSEDLFGDLMDFSGGPTRGEEADRLRSAIEWMRGEFLARLQDFLTDEQFEVWDRFVTGGGLEALDFEENAQRDDETQQTQYVRINNNKFTAENGTYGSGRAGTEVIGRGGAGAFHGRVQFLINDDALNARNPFATNKPPYQERDTSVDVSGPLIPGFLTTGFSFRQNEQEGVTTVNATLPDEVIELGVKRPTTERNLTVRNTFQLAEAHSLSVDFNRVSGTEENQGIGGFTLPERGYTSKRAPWNLRLHQFSMLSPRHLYETRFSFERGRREVVPLTDGVQIDVLGAFNSGGAQNNEEARRRGYTFSNMYTRLGERWTLKTGMSVDYDFRSSLTRNNFVGNFTFSSLEDFEAGQPGSFRINQGDPSLEINQWEWGFFAQNDFTLTPKFTLMLGARYGVQTNLSDHNDFSPRLGIAYAVGPETVIRGGVGIFHQTIGRNLFEDQRRLDGTRQFEVVIDNPSYPDPFQSGSLQETFPSVRVDAEDLATPYNLVANLSLEKTIFTNLFFSAGYEVNRENHRLRFRNLNAPFPSCVDGLPEFPTNEEIQACRPDPTRGNIDSLESSASELRHAFRFDYRQRFSIFRVSGGYTLQWGHVNSRPGGPGPAFPTNNYELSSEWVRLRQGPHAWNTTVNAELPWGVFLTGILTARSGSRYDITTGRDDNRDGHFDDRPTGFPKHWGQAPGRFTTDFNISKAFYLGGRPLGGGSGTNVNAFVNVTNAFNHTLLGEPSGVLTSPNFGKSTSASDPRVVQGGVRFQF